MSVLNYGYLVKTFKSNLVKILNFNKVFKVNDVMFFQKKIRLMTISTKPPSGSVFSKARLLINNVVITIDFVTRCY